MKLYHGSNVEIQSIDLCKCSPNKDFGQGFYLTDIYEQAEQMAIRRTRITDAGTPTVSTFLFEDSLLNGNTLKIKVFDCPSSEWALFVMQNRMAEQNNYHHEYDIVIGPIADDGVAYQLERYTKNMITLEMLVEELTYRKLSRQYFFGTELAISKLQKQ